MIFLLHTVINLWGRKIKKTENIFLSRIESPYIATLLPETSIAVFSQEVLFNCS